MNDFDLASNLAQGINELGLTATAQQLQQLLNYQQLLLHWNKVYSLTAITDPHAVLIEHLLDGLSVVPYFSAATSILDVGSGMGVPGVILALMLPHIAVTVLDSNSKKCAFLLQVKIKLGLSNLTVIKQRVENYQPAQLFSIITARAFADLNLFIKLTRAILAPNGYYLALKSTQGQIEVSQLPNWQNQIIKLKVPFLTAQRFLIKLYL